MASPFPPTWFGPVITGQMAELLDYVTQASVDGPSAANAIKTVRIVMVPNILEMRTERCIVPTGTGNIDSGGPSTMPVVPAGSIAAKVYSEGPALYRDTGVNQPARY